MPHNLPREPALLKAYTMLPRLAACACCEQPSATNSIRAGLTYRLIAHGGAPSPKCRQTPAPEPQARAAPLTRWSAGAHPSTDRSTDADETQSSS